ncbi:archaeosortase A [Halorussus gelatinilyticus]|uniref:Archaeosortase A n=1 Tax=Halorussus gelatinilyticus TaxID=2937524 RepID=A0A8U0IEE4_9EURY|nr:archaeosortase A [Halorussus gelatinilyticus]UPV99277.1 archaeosortase A [Halorussus gelatinilyticus]
MTSALTDGLAWLAVGLFAAATALDWYDDGHGRGRARYLGSAAWVVFGVFWLALFPHFAFEQKSFVEGALSLAALPACLYTAYLLAQGRETLFLLSRAVAFMGLIYMPFTMIPSAKTWLIETVAWQGGFVMEQLGYEFQIIQHGRGLDGTYRFDNPTHGVFTVNVLLACTGIGSMAIFGGLIAAVRAPLRRKLKGIAIAIPIIWALNLVRVVFITLAFSQQWLQIFVEPTVALVGYENPNMVSYFISDRVLAQSLSVVALVGIAWAVAREVPELLTVGEDVLYIVTGDEYDLHDAVGTDRPLATDGDGR